MKKLFTCSLISVLALLFSSNDTFAQQYKLFKGGDPFGPVIENFIGWHYQDEVRIGSNKQESIETLATNRTTENTFYSAEQSANTLTKEAQGADLVKPVLRVYPNPATQFVQLQLTAVPTAIRLYNLSGQLVKDFPVNGQSQLRLDVQNMAAGMYIVRVESKEQYFTQKLSIQ